MKNIGFVTNKVLGQSLASVVGSRPELELNPYLLLDYKQAILDAQVWKLDIAVVDLAYSAAKGDDAAEGFCWELRQELPRCRILLLVSPDDKETCDKAIAAIQSKSADDYVFYDTTLNYLFAKLTSF